MSELKANFSVITQPDLARNARTKVNGIDLTLKARNGKYYLISANYKSSVRLSTGHDAGVAYPSVQFVIDGLGNGVVRALTGDPSAASLPMTAGTFTDSLPAYAARIYEITPQ